MFAKTSAAVIVMKSLLYTGFGFSSRVSSADFRVAGGILLLLERLLDFFHEPALRLKSFGEARHLPDPFVRIAVQKLALLFGELADVPEVDERSPLFGIAVVDHDVAGMHVVVHHAALEESLVDPLPDDLLEEERALSYGAHLDAERGVVLV